MAADHGDRASFNLYAFELAGSSRDRPLRFATEQLIRRLLTEIDRRDWCAAKSYFSDYPTIILALDSPGHIFIGKGGLDTFFEVWDEIAGARTIPKLVLVDRGRVSCHLTEFVIKEDKANDEDSLVMEHSYVLIFDLDDNHEIARMEYRETKGDRREHYGGKKMLDDLIKDAKRAAITINYDC